MYELRVTVKLYRAACSMSDIDAHFFRIRGIPIRAFRSMSVSLHKNI